MKSDSGRKLYAIILLIALLVIAGGCGSARAATQTSASRLMLDTFCKISIYGSYGTQDDVILNDTLDLCSDYEALLSVTVEGSDVWRINHAGGAPVSVAPQTIEVIKTGLKYGELSGGMFDITVGRLSDLWDFTGLSGVPSESDIARVRATVDYGKVIIDGDTVTMLDTEAWIDLGGVAKGYIADKAAEFLEERGVIAAVIDFGGNIVVMGEKPDASAWRVGVTTPFSERDDLIGIVETSEASVVSSGIYERRFIENGVLYHHILDPNTGMPVKSDIVGATVVSANSADADALSTTLVLLGSERAPDIIANAPDVVGALLILEDGEIMQLGEIDFQEVSE